MNDLNFGLRFFLFEPDGTLRRVSNRSFGRLVSRRGALPQFAGKRIRGVEATIEIEARRAVALAKVLTDYWVFDAEGQFDEGHTLRVQRAIMNSRTWSLDPRRANIVNLERIRNARRTLEEARWTPTEQEVHQIMGTIWPEYRAAGTSLPTSLQISPPPAPGASP